MSDDSPTILVVDDEAQVRTITELMLQQFGFDVTTAEDGVQALDMVRATPGAFDLVVMDLTMPKMSGDETFRAMREIRPDLEVLFTSGYDEGRSADILGRDGVRGFLQKPFDLQILVSKVREALGQEVS